MESRPTTPFPLPGLDDLWAAASRIRPHVHRTPLLRSRWLEEVCGCEVHLKPENLQRAGAFKIRGAINALLCAQARGELGPAGVLTYSSGNHGQAVALAARILGVSAVVVVPEDITRVKRAAIEGLGARVVACGFTSEDRHRGALEIARESRAHIIPPYDHPDIIAGQGTLALEALEDLPGAEAVVVPVGGGGLLAGVSIGIKSLRPEIRVIGAEPASANDTALSLQAGRRVQTPPSKSVADGLRALTPGELTFEAIRRHVDNVLCVDDDEILAAQQNLLEREKLLVEPSGAVAAAVCARHISRAKTVRVRARAVIVVLSGGNAELPLAGGRVR